MLTYAVLTIFGIAYAALSFVAVGDYTSSSGRSRLPEVAKLLLTPGMAIIYGAIMGSYWLYTRVTPKDKRR